MSIDLVHQMVMHHAPPAKVLNIIQHRGWIRCEFAKDGDSIEDCANWLLGVVVEYLKGRGTPRSPTVNFDLYTREVDVTWPQT